MMGLFNPYSPMYSLAICAVLTFVLLIVNAACPCSATSIGLPGRSRGSMKLIVPAMKMTTTSWTVRRTT